MKCDKCDGTIMYICSFKSKLDLTLNGDVLFDKNVPIITFCFMCRSCDNKMLLEWHNGKIGLTKNYGTPECKHKEIYCKHGK